MKKLTKQQIEALNQIRRSKGRFFGLLKTDGEILNAQFRGETDQYIHVNDRNNRIRHRKIAKSSVLDVNI